MTAWRDSRQLILAIAPTSRSLLLLSGDWDEVQGEILPSCEMEAVAPFPPPSHTCLSELLKGPPWLCVLDAPRLSLHPHQSHLQSSNKESAGRDCGAGNTRWHTPAVLVLRG